MRRLATSTLLVVLGMASACSGELVLDEGSGTNTNMPQPSGADAGIGTPSAGQSFFDLNIQPLLTVARPKGACIVCHQGTNTLDGPDFLGATAGDNYATLVANPVLVGTSAAASRFLTRGDHAGDAFCAAAGTPYNDCAANETNVISQWIAIENQ